MNTNDFGDLLIELINVAIFNTSNTQVPEELDYNGFLKFCRSHKLENIAYLALQKLGVPSEKLADFENRYFFNACIVAKQQAYLDLIKKEFNENEVPYLILKGVELSKLYPSNDMRLSSDIDILVGEKTVECKPLMQKIGFKIDAFNEENEDHDVYCVPGVSCELHPVLIQGEYSWKEECNQIPQRLVKGDGCECHMTPEDFYFYNLAHAAKHMKFSGVGIKVFLDLELILYRYGDQICWEKVDKILKKANLFEFNQCARELCDYWFHGGEKSERISAMKEYIYNSGFCGTVQQKQATEFSELSGNSGNPLRAKISKGWSVFAAPYQSYAVHYPILKKHKLLTPVFRVYRVVSAAIFKRELVKDVMGQFDSVDVDYSRQVKAFKNSIGL